MLGSQKDSAGLLPETDDRPADVLLLHWSQGKDTALYITVVNPLQGSLVHQVAKKGLRGVQHAFQAKMARYGERCDQEGIVFVPLAVDMFGGLHPAALQVLVKLSRQVARQERRRR